MAKKEINMSEIFETFPEVPEEFKKWCYSFLPKVPVYYKRRNSLSDCECGKCGKRYVLKERATRHEKAICPHCGNVGFYEWKKVKRPTYYDKHFFITQRTTNGNLLVRYFGLYQRYQQFTKEKVMFVELKRFYFTLGDVFLFNNEEHWTGGRGWKRCWQVGKGHVPMEDGEMYQGWEEEIASSCMKYCDVNGIRKMCEKPILNILIAFANNPAIEMYYKAGMEKLLRHLLWKEGKTKWINRRGKSLEQQLRLKEKAKIKRFVESGGNISLLEILLLEQKTGQVYTSEQEEFLARRIGCYAGSIKKVEYLLQYMTLQQLMNRIEKYWKGPGYNTESSIIDRYYDYLQMRQELGYDMTNQLYLYPKNLKEKHDQMVKEREARRDELHIVKKLQEFPHIAERYEKLEKQYGYTKEGYIIRPAKDAGEIIMEGRLLHHCVGGDHYLRKHDRGDTTILFLRKESKQDKPYYTIEIKGNEIIQWYGKNDKKPDREIIGPWLDAYMEVLKNTKKRSKQTMQKAV